MRLTPLGRIVAVAVLCAAAFLVGSFGLADRGWYCGTHVYDRCTP